VKKSLFIFLISLCPVLLFAQQKITVVSNIKVSFSEKRGTYRWYKPVFAHEGSTLAADSADYNQGDNFFDAYGNVVITQPNGTVVYADKLHYTEDNQEAILTNNVRLVDHQATLTTNYLTYNMRSKIGTYINNGQIISGADTLNSKNGYYFENSQDAYFRHNVVVRTPDVKIHTDTMRYNSGSKMTYFYGPTTIGGKNGRLYTENGDYNTESDKARFGKNNLYTEGSKFLWGDSLIYDGKSGNGRAVKNVNFIDTAQHIVMRGQLGTYTKATQSTMVTQNAYIVLATKSDSTEQTNPQDSIPLNTPTGLKDTTSLEIDSANHQRDSIAKPTPSRVDSTYMSADTLLSQVIKLKDYQFANLKMSREGGELEDEDVDEDMGEAPINNQPIDTIPLEKPTDTLQTLDSLAVKDFLAIKEAIPIDSLGKKLTDSVKVSAQDTLLKDSLKKEIPDQLQVADSIKKEIDSLKTGIEAPVPLAIDTNETKIDSALLSPKKGDVDSLINQATKTALSKQETDTLASDTAETRIIIAYHNVKIFKSDLQAIADSAYFGYPDSIIRCFGSPIFWSQGSQLSADTAYMQLKNEKIDNMLLKNKAFIVSTELDSTKYHQVKGKKISGFFTNDKLDRVFVDGNAESIYYTIEDNKFTGMARSISSRIKVLFEDNKMTDVISIRKAATTYYPIAKIPEDQEILEGFIWKPELRPKSKEEVISGTKTRAKDSPENESEKKDTIESKDKSKEETIKENEGKIEDKIKTEIKQKENPIKVEEKEDVLEGEQEVG
jgi:lipopolysaccharide export system protein LptA